MEQDETRFDQALATIERAKTLEDLIWSQHSLRDLYQVANLGYHALHIEGVGNSDLPVFATCDPAWIKRYFDREFIEIDPIAKASKQTDLPIDWSCIDRSFTDAKRYFLELSSFEIGRNGMSIPIHSSQGNAIFTFTSQIADEGEWRSFRRHRKPELALLARYLQEKIIAVLKDRQKVATLSRQERTCLQLYAKGHNAPSIADLLGLSVHTVRMHLSRAQKRLGAQSRAETVARALAQGLIRVTRPAMALVFVKVCDKLPTFENFILLI